MRRPIAADAITDFSIAGVERGEADDGYDFVGTTIVAAGPSTPNLEIAADTLFEARVALRAAMLAIADATARQHRTEPPGSARRRRRTFAWQ